SGRERHAEQIQVLQPSFRYAVTGIRRQRLIRAVGQNDPLEPEESGAAGYSPQIMGIANAIKNKQRLAVLRPCRSRASIETGQWPRSGDCHDAAVQRSARDAREFGLVQLTI